jgi:hypothetical protein
MDTLILNSMEYAMPKTQKGSSKSSAFLKNWPLMRFGTEKNCWNIFFEAKGSMDVFSICCSTTSYVEFLVPLGGVGGGG